MLKVNVPSTNQSFYTKAQSDALAGSVPELRRKYGSIISVASRLAYVPEWAIYAKMLIENASGNSNIVSSAGAVGLMQIKPLSATDMITIERRARRLTNEEKAELKRLVPAKYNALVNAQMGNTLLTMQDLRNPELNLLIGAIHMSTLIEEHSVNDTVRIDLVGLRYNQGYFFRRESLRDYTGTTDELLSTLSGEARNYVLKLCGKFGALEITT